MTSNTTARFSNINVIEAAVFWVDDYPKAGRSLGILAVNTLNNNLYIKEIEGQEAFCSRLAADHSCFLALTIKPVTFLLAGFFYGRFF